MKELFVLKCCKKRPKNNNESNIKSTDRFYCKNLSVLFIFLSLGRIMLNSHSLIYTGHTLITAFRKLKCQSSLNFQNYYYHYYM